MYTIEKKTLTDIADAIREKTGKSGLLLPGDMPGEIERIKDEDNPFALKNYIESNGTQYINTGYALPADQSKVRFDIVCNFTNAGRYPSIYGSRDGNKKNATQLWVRDPSRYKAYFSWTGNYINIYEGGSISPKYNKKTHIIVTQGSVVLSTAQNPNYYVVQNDSPENANTTYSIYLFNINQANNAVPEAYCTMKLYRFSIYHGNDLAHEYIPWQNSGIACLKDTVNDNLLYNAGTGDFVYGTDE